jgi:hypothetical protein
MTYVTKYLFLRGQPKRKLHDRQFGPFLVDEKIGKHNYRLKLPTTIRLHSVFYFNNLRPCSTSSLRPIVPVTTPEIDGDEFNVSRICIVCIKALSDRRGRYLLFMTHFNDDDIPHVWHRSNEVHRTNALQYFQETPQWHALAQTNYIDFMHAYLARNHESL